METQILRISDKELYENRLKFVKGLQDPERNKEAGCLEKIDEQGNVIGRGCLGHGCDIFRLERIIIKDLRMGYKPSVVYYDSELDYAPPRLVEILGLKNCQGGTLDHAAPIKGTKSLNLVALNDQTDLTIQQIGKILEPLIMGGEGTPFTKINYSPEESS